MSQVPNPTNTPEIVFTMGLPAAGKTTVAQMTYGATHQFIDCDTVKESHPEYDPSNPATLHSWSKTVVREMMNKVLESGVGQIVYDTTGTNAVRMAREMAEAREAGFKVTLVLVSVPLTVSLERNLSRPRVVPMGVLIEKADIINRVFEDIKTHADEVQIIDNSTHRAELV